MRSNVRAGLRGGLQVLGPAASALEGARFVFGVGGKDWSVTVIRLAGKGGRRPAGHSASRRRPAGAGRVFFREGRDARRVAVI